MTQTEAPYCIPLDPCLHPEHRPASPVIRAGEQQGPEPWRRHALAAIDAAFTEVGEKLSAPPQKWCGNGRRYVLLWETVEISVARDGTNWQARHVGEHPPVGECYVRPGLAPPINRFSWTFALAPLLAAACRGKLPYRTQRDEATRFIHSVLVRSYFKYVDWNRLRRQVLLHLQLDPLAVSLTRRTFPGGMGGLDDFNWVARNARELALVAIEHPRLLPFLQVVSGCETPVMRRFEQAMREAGITPTARRKLERWGFDTFSEAICGDPIDDDVQIVADFANLLERIGADFPPPEIFGHLAMRGSPGLPAPEWFMRALWANLCVFPIDMPDVPPELEMAVAWLATHPPEPDDNQKAAGWRWIVEQAWKHRLANDVEVREPWAVPFESIEVDGYTVVPLCNAVQLREEAQAMRNCVGNYEADCRSGTTVVFSIRKGERRVANMTAWRAKGKDGLRWAEPEVAGKANRAVPDLGGLARRVVEML